MSNNCLECGDKIIGRVDKKFCNDSCRNTYNNRYNKDVNNLMRSINRRLRKNYNILNQLNFKEGKTKTNKEHLEKLGYKFEYFTHLRKYKNGSEYRFIYNIGYKVLENGWLLVVKND